MTSISKDRGIDPLSLDQRLDLMPSTLHAASVDRVESYSSSSGVFASRNRGLLATIGLCDRNKAIAI